MQMWSSDGNRETNQPGVSTDDLFDVLSNPRRRYAVHLLKHHEQNVALGTMATQIAAWENDIDIAEVNGTERKRVYTALQQSHLPKMDQLGVVNFNKRCGTVEPTPSLEEVDLYLDVVKDNEIPWSEYYLGLSGVSAALVAAIWMNAWPFTLVSEIAWMAFIVGAFVFSAAAHKYYSGRMEVGKTEKPPEIR